MLNRSINYGEDQRVDMSVLSPTKHWYKAQRLNQSIEKNLRRGKTLAASRVLFPYYLVVYTPEQGQAAGRVRRPCDDAPLSSPVRLCDYLLLLRRAAGMVSPARKRRKAARGARSPQRRELP